MDRHLEIESKFDVDEHFGMPDLLGLPGVASVQPLRVQRLVATYYDTEDLRLLRTRATLRRRTGGGDSGWHLKLPAGPDGRLELRRPPGRPADGVPQELSDLSRARVRDRELAPVARLTTRRTVLRLLDDQESVLAEVADDAVTAETTGDRITASSWREIEVELVDGSRKLLAATGKRLRRAGATPAAGPSKLARALSERLREAISAGGVQPAPDAAPVGPGSTAGEVALAYLREQYDELQARDPDVRMQVEDAVHKMRVATRRLRSALATFRPLLDREVTEPLRAELKWLGGVLGEPRDAEVLGERLRGELAALPAELAIGPVLERVDEALRTVYDKAYVRAVAELDDKRYWRVLDSLEALLADPPLTPAAGAPARKELRRLVHRSLRRVERAARWVDEAPDAEERDLRLHEVRKAAKRARYAGESVSAVLGDPARTFAARMREVQDVLGDHQDSVVAQRLLLDLGERAQEDGESAFTYGVLLGLQRCRAESTAADYTALWEKVDAAARKWPG